eukprot:s2067_g18.t1
MDLPASLVKWAKHVSADSEDMVDSPTPPEPDSCSAKAVNEIDDERSWQLISGQQSESASSSTPLQYIPQLHAQQTEVSTALTVLRSSKRIKLPWETGPLAPLFVKDGLSPKLDIQQSNLGMADVLNPQPKAQAVFPKPVNSEASTHFAKKRIVCTSYNIQDDELRSRALNKFRVLVSWDLHATQIGVSMLNCLGSLDANTDVMQILSDSLSNKATGTLMKRASSLWCWANWIAASNKGTCFDQPEDVLYEYMNYLRSSGSAPASASHFIEAMRFSHQVFGLQKMDLSTTLTSRVTGAAHSMFMHKRKLKQAPAFSVKAVAVFENLCNEDPRAHVRAICGAILFCIFACVRWFDAMRIESVWLDKYVTMCLLEAETALHKTSMSKESKTRLLPYTSLGKFLGSSDWAQSFMAARTKAGLDDPKLFLPSWNEERTLVGHHVEPQTKSSTTYSRDAQVLLQYKVLKVIKLIHSGRLKPDVSRAERLSIMVNRDASNHDEDLADAWEEPEIGASDSDSEDLDIDDVGEHQSGLDASLQSVRDPVPGESFDLDWYIHFFTGVVHAARTSDADPEAKLLCRRAITVNLTKTDVESSEMKTGLMCMQCSSAMRKDSLFEEEDEPLENGGDAE